MRQKYIMFDECFPLIFGECFNHKDVTVAGKTATSAGFVQILVNEEGKLTAHCYGESIGLAMKPSEWDEQIINKFLRRE